MEQSKAIAAIQNELALAKCKHPNFPPDTIHQVAIMMEEAGEAIQAAIDLTYHPRADSIQKLRNELHQTGAMVLRCLESL